MQLRIVHKGLLMVLVPSLLELFFAVRMLDLAHRLEIQARQEATSKEIIYHADEIYISAVSAGLNVLSLKVPGLPIPGNPQAAQRHLLFIDNEMRIINKLVVQGSQQAQQLTIIERKIENLLDIFSKDMERSKRSDGSGLSLLLGSAATFASVQANTMALQEAVLRFKQPELELSKRVQAQISQTRDEMVKTSIAAICFTILISCWLVMFFSKSITSRIAVLVENSKRLSGRTSLLAELTGGDELILVDRSLHRTAEELKELEILKNEIYAMIAHDLRSPLTAVCVVLELLSQERLGPLADLGKTNVQLALRNVEKILDLINDLLDLEKLQAGKMQLDVVETTALDILEELLQTVIPLAESKGIVLKTTHQDVSLSCDKSRIGQVLVNLVSNALKFAPRDSTVTISCHIADDQIVFSVVDQGRGIPAAALAQIFAQFTQVDARDARRGFGTGLGLSISKMIVEAHGGKIGVESVEGEGSTFFFKLPRVLISAYTTTVP